MEPIIRIKIRNIIRIHTRTLDHIQEATIRHIQVLRVQIVMALIAIAAIVFLDATIIVQAAARPVQTETAKQLKILVNRHRQLIQE